MNSQMEGSVDFSRILESANNIRQINNDLDSVFSEANRHADVAHNSWSSPCSEAAYSSYKVFEQNFLSTKSLLNDISNTLDIIVNDMYGKAESIAMDETTVLAGDGLGALPAAGGTASVE